MTTIPPHYTDRYIIERFNKALHFVQHLPATSSFQPTKSQKLELYALYKQVSQGDINTQRPGLFDVVGRAKWDAWKKLEGLSILEARHIYVEALLRAATEAYKKNLGREEAQQIIHTFAIMKPSGEDQTSSSEEDDLSTDETTSNQDEDDTSAASEDEEEQAYLRDIQQSHTSLNRRMSDISTRRPPSVASVQTMVTAPMVPSTIPSRPSSVTTNNNVRPPRLGQTNRGNENKRHMTRDDLRVLPNKDSFDEQDFDDSVNPWQHIKSHSDENIRPMSRATMDRRTANGSTSHLRLPSPMYTSTRRIASPSPPPPPQQVQSMTSIYQQSPVLGSSTSSSVTATPQLTNMLLQGGHTVTDRPVYTPDSRSVSRNQPRSAFSEQQYTSVVALGPATKRALESLQNEVIALNDRIDDLRRELVERDKHRAAINKKSDQEESDDIGDSWRWVIKAAARYAGVNLMTALVFFFILYKSGSPIAYAILKQSNKLWQSFKLRVLISNVVV